MPLDYRLILQDQGDPSAMSRGLESGMKMADMYKQGQMREQQFNRDQAEQDRSNRMRDLAAQAYKRDESGNFVADQAQLDEMAKQGFGAEAAKIAQQDRAAKLQAQSAQYDQNLKHLSTGYELGKGVKDQAGYTLYRNNMIKLGVPGAEKMDPTFDPKMHADMLGQAKQAERLALSAKERIDADLKELELGRKSEVDAANIGKIRAETGKLNAEARNLGAGGGPGGKAEGVKALDRDFAKDYNEWTSGGSKIAQTEIQKLRGIANDLNAGKVTTGGLTGAFPDRLTSNSVLKARADVQSTVMNSLRAILGAQFTEKEGERIIKNTWNEADSTENNLARINRLVGDLEAKAQAKSAKAGFFEKNETLRGYKAGSAPAGSDEDQQAIAWAQANRQDPRAAKILELHGVR